MGVKSIFDNAFGQLGDERQVGYWSVIGEIVRIKMRFFDERRDS